MNLLLFLFNKIAHYFHLAEEFLVSMAHVSDCVTTLETPDLLSHKLLTNIDILYGNDNKSYKLRIPVNLCKTEAQALFSATLNEHIDLTDHVRSLAGPFHNFFYQPLLVRDLVPPKYHDSFEGLEVMTSDLRIHHYDGLGQRIHFHYGMEWFKYDLDEFDKTCHRLAYIDLNF